MESVNEILQRAHRTAMSVMCDIDAPTVSRVLLSVADNLEAASDSIIAANASDLSRMDATNPKYDRLKLTAERIADIAADMRNVAALPSPIGKVLSSTTRPNGMVITKVTVPFGVIGVIYEARPNVTADVFSLCMRSGNVAVLKGGKDAEESNMAICDVIGSTLDSFGLGRELCTLLPATHEATEELLHAEGLVDLVIPRGSKRLIDFVRSKATIPVIETGAGVCHAYFDLKGDTTKGAAIINNAKTRRVSVCNALDCLIIHRERLSYLPQICAPLTQSNVVIYADAPSYAALEGHYPATSLLHSTDDSYGTEFQDYKMSIRTVASIEDALEHIARFGSKHSESIITEDMAAAAFFTRRVDASCVYRNLPTSFTDGAQFGFGAEIGISTQKLHARGPMALPELTTYKYIITGDGQIRKP